MANLIVGIGNCVVFVVLCATTACVLDWMVRPKCPACQRRISAKATKCGHCRSDVYNQPGIRWGFIAMTILAMLVFLIAAQISGE